MKTRGNHDAWASFSECGEYRYELGRIWDRDSPVWTFIGLNPSTADENQEDPTLRKCLGFVKRWGGGGLVMTNLFAYRSIDPKGLRECKDPVGPENDALLLEAIRRCPDDPNGSHDYHRVVVCWGDHGRLFQRCDRVLSLLRANNVRVHRLGHLTQTRMPRHPARIGYDTPLMEWTI